MKLFPAVFIFLLCGSPVYGCMAPPEGLYDQHNNLAKLYFQCALVFFCISIALQLLKNHRKLWIPILYASLLGYIPAYIYHIEFSGTMCGNLPLIYASRTLACGMAILLVYEIASYIWTKRKNAI